ncbi:hypothetical protein [Shewanella pneumatophori]|uniref:DUF3298 domain-containing protein n=1 Tax=Shewanella pneumatophori TaxID=314092 RepID=A0A9X1ZCF1_9GAMM|nr:hypothetical protein [Shewanella pneumatophori]MCL1139694.1 hypothetical protein [Shewanella pneumatophori]
MKISNTINLSAGLMLAALSLNTYATPESKVVISDTFSAAAIKHGFKPELVGRLCEPLPDIVSITCHHSGEDGPFENLIVQYRYNTRTTNNDMFKHLEINDIRIDLKHKQINFWSGHQITTPDGISVNRIEGTSNSYIETGGMRGFVSRTDRRFQQQRDTEYELSHTSEFTYKDLGRKTAIDAITHYQKMVSDNDYVVAYEEDQVIEPVAIMQGESFTFPMSEPLRQRLIDVVEQSTK